jgi:hypothetical protein
VNVEPVKVVEFTAALNVAVTAVVMATPVLALTGETDETCSAGGGAAPVVKDHV